MFPISLLLFSEPGLLQFLMMCSFSERQRLHVLCPGWYLLHLCRIVHSTFGSGFRPLFQTWAARVVADFVFAFLNVDVWRLKRVLKEFSVIPTYSAESILALYTTASVRHLFSTGHLALSLQLHSFSA